MTSSHHAVCPRRRPRRSPQFQWLERRDLLAAVPFGASPDDTGEYMLGEVLVSVVLLESNGQIDSSSEDWQAQTIARVKQNVTEGLQWWEDLLAAQQSVHSLEFKLDFTFADNPIATGYEPISRKSDDFVLWIEDFFAEVGLTGTESYSDRIRQFNHAQRLAHETNWAFTIFVVSAEHDADGRFDTAGSFSQSFAFAGGRFFVTNSLRPASSIAHEAAHMFWAMDEYAGSRTYFDQRGYYNTQNLNAFDGHPNAASRVRSIMDSSAIGYSTHDVSPSALETIGWRDSDDDGIFDVLDVHHLLVGAGDFDPQLRQYHFQGYAQVQTLPNLNPSGSGNAMTIGQIDRVEVRYGDSAWQTVAEPRAYRAEVDFTVTIPDRVTRIEVRAVDSRTGVSSNIVGSPFDAEPGGWQNLAEPTDVNADSLVTPLDALLIVNQLNLSGSRPLTGSATSPPYLDVNGDGFLSPLDALLVINRLNTSTTPASVAPISGVAESENPARSWIRLAADAAIAWQTRRQDSKVDGALVGPIGSPTLDDSLSDTLVLADFR
jgi:hypothetical protein